MRIAEMLEGVRVLRSMQIEGLEPSGVTYDSRRVRPGDLFVAVRGLKEDGLAHAAEAVAAGASAVVVGAGRYQSAVDLLAGTGARVLEVDDERAALAHLARNAAGRPDLALRVIGVTGTNGKTTTAHVLASMLEASGTRCGVIGTVEYRLAGRVLPAVRTTPEAADTHAYLASMLEAGAGACVMEVSSQALDLRRVEGMRFAACVFTNLTQDHLDYHKDMERYFQAKRRLFTEIAPGAPAVLNADDAWAARLAAEAGGRAVLFGESESAHVRLVGMSGDLDGSKLAVLSGGEEIEIATPLPGRPNASNVLAAAAAARALGLPWDAVREGAEMCGPVRGRLEQVREGQPFAVIVDFAHTDDALRNVLTALRPLTEGRLIVVFGAGGDRDKGKRPLMGERAVQLADLAWLTSDNPRTEDPVSIIGMVLEGVRRVPGGEGRCRVEPDRSKAIAAAIAAARPGDTVLIAGKGHEAEQIIGSRRLPFDDVQVARDAIRAHGPRGPEDDGRDVG